MRLDARWMRQLANYLGMIYICMIYHPTEIAIKLVIVLGIKIIMLSAANNLFSPVLKTIYKLIPSGKLMINLMIFMPMSIIKPKWRKCISKTYNCKRKSWH